MPPTYHRHFIPLTLLCRPPSHPPSHPPHPPRPAVCTAGYGWQLQKPVPGVSTAKQLPVCRLCPAGFASGPAAPEPSAFAAGLLWGSRRATRHGAVCVSCPTKASSKDRTKCVEAAAKP